MKNKKMLNLLRIIMPVLAVGLTAQPDAVQMNWMGGHTTYTSGFSLLPVGYAIWGPMLAGLAAIAASIFAILYVVKGNTPLRKWLIGLSVFAAMMSLTPLVFGSLTLIGGMISVVMALEAVLMYVAGKQKM